MSLIVLCDNKDLTVTDIYRLVSAVDADGNFYLRTYEFYVRVYDDGTDPATLTDLADCESGDITILDILRGLLVVSNDGQYALNIATIV